MANELIREIVQLEEELRRRVAGEEEEARAWLEGVRASLADVGEEKRRALREERTAGLAAARKKARAEAEARRRRAEDLSRRLESLSEEELRPLILEKLTAILPARDDDHPDVED